MASSAVLEDIRQTFLGPSIHFSLCLGTSPGIFVQKSSPAPQFESIIGKVIFEQRLDESEAVIGSADSGGKSIVQAKCTAREKSL